MLPALRISGRHRPLSVRPAAESPRSTSPGTSVTTGRSHSRRCTRSWPPCSASVAVLLAGLGDTVQAFRWLERAADERDPFLVYDFVIDPLLDGLRTKPQGQALLKRMHLPYVRSP
jgi:hypothetical protein